MTEPRRVALAFRGDRRMRGTITLENSRLAPIGQALADAGLVGEAAVFTEDLVDEVRDQLLAVDAVLVWVDPVTDGRDRTVLDALLREVAANGVLVSAHPDTILAMGTKEVLYRTRDLGWGTDTDLYTSVEDFMTRFPSRLAQGAVRVLKQHRGNAGIGVWRVQTTGSSTSAPTAETPVIVQSARHRGGDVETTTLAEFMDRCAKYFQFSEGHGRLIDQAFQPRITDGMIRCYLVRDEVVGFSRQYAPGRSPTETDASGELIPDDRVFGLPGDKTMCPPETPELQALRQHMQNEWVPEMRRTLGLTIDDLPFLWDADFLFGPHDDVGNDTYIIGEINCSAVAPFPPEAPAKMASAIASALGAD